MLQGWLGPGRDGGGSGIQGFQALRGQMEVRWKGLQAENEGLRTGRHVHILSGTQALYPESHSPPDTFSVTHITSATHGTSPRDSAPLYRLTGTDTHRHTFTDTYIFKATTPPHTQISSPHPSTHTHTHTLSTTAYTEFIALTVCHHFIKHFTYMTSFYSHNTPMR